MRRGYPHLAVLAVGIGLAGVSARADDPVKALAPPTPPTKEECVAANESAQDLQTSGKLRDAATKLRTCISDACPRVVREDCADRFQQVSLATPTVVFQVSAADGADVSATSVEMDGAPFASLLDGRPVPVDPGVHTFTFSVAGRASTSRSIALRRGERLRRDVIFRSEASTDGGPDVKSAEAVEAEEGSRSDLSAEPSTGAADAGGAKPPAPASPLTPEERTIAYASLGAGGAGIVLGAVFGALAMGDKASLGNACTNHVCPASSQPDIDALHTNAVASDVAIGFGLVGLAAGAGLLFVWPQIMNPSSALSVTPWVGAGGLGGAGMRGTFR